MATSTPAFGPAPEGCLASEVLNRIGDKWSVYAIASLGGGTLRFSELRRQIDGISQRMLTATLRALERDGLVTRTMYPEIPPRVEYALTPLGKSLLDVVGTLIAWSETHTADIDRARTDYDQRLRSANSPPTARQSPASQTSPATSTRRVADGP